jgi:ABC-type multidrug transport system permease subunit
MSTLRNILVLGHHDIRVFLRDRSAYVWLFLVPMAFVYFMSFAARGPGGPADARPELVLDNRDTGFMGRVFERELGSQGLDLKRPEEAGDARRGVIVPEDFTARVLEKQRVELELFTVEGSDTGMEQIVGIRILRTLAALNVRLARHAIDHGGAPPTEEALLASMERPAAVSVESSHGGRKPRPVGFGFSLPGNLVGYLFLNLLIFGGASVAEQRRCGVLRRVAVSGLSRAELLFGKIYGLILLGGVQIAFFLLVGEFALGLDLAHALPGILLTMLVFAWVASSFGVLIGFLLESEDKIVGLCLAIALPMAAIGGCWWPLEVAPDFARVLAKLVPTGWALDALHQLVTFGAGIERALPALGVLALFGIVGNVLAARFLRV